MKWWILRWLVLCVVCTIPTICTDQTFSECSNRSEDNQGHTQNGNSGCSNGSNNRGHTQNENSGHSNGSDNNPGLSGSHPQPDSAVGGPHSCVAQCKIFHNGISIAQCCLNVSNQNIFHGSQDDIFQSIMDLSEALEETDVTDSTSLSFKNIVAAIKKPNVPFAGMKINANDNEVKLDEELSDTKVSVRLPTELDVGQNNTIVFCMIHLPNQTVLNISDELYEGRLFGLSVSGKNISGLQERVNITVNITTNTNKTQEPRCVFLDVSTNTFRSNGCLTLRGNDLKEVICSCDHLTYFGILLVSVSEGTLSSAHQQILSYITIIGCSISLLALVITVLIFITNRELREEDSKKIHISLSVALILLNLHFLPSEAVAALSLPKFCFYMGLGLHYSLLATFSWMALEGLHLYLLLVKVFNIYIRRYLLKLSVVGWGVPAVIVSVVVIVDTNSYGYAPLDVSNPNGSVICYLTNDMVKMGSTVGVFSVVFLFNVIMFGVTIRWFVAARSSKESHAGGSARNSARKEICTLLSLMVLLGITWGLVFFSYGHLTAPGLYAFCILNSLQGVFIFIYFVLSLKKPKASAAEQSSETHTTNSRI